MDPAGPGDCDRGLKPADLGKSVRTTKQGNAVCMTRSVRGVSSRPCRKWTMDPIPQRRSARRDRAARRCDAAPRRAPTPLRLRLIESGDPPHAKRRSPSGGRRASMGPRASAPPNEQSHRPRRGGRRAVAKTPYPRCQRAAGAGRPRRIRAAREAGTRLEHYENIWGDLSTPIRGCLRAIVFK